MNKKLLFFYFLTTIPTALAYEQETKVIQKIPSPSVILGIGVLCILTFFAIIFIKKKWKNYEKKIIFWSFAIVISIVTLYLLFYTLLVNLSSETKGPVHWHADFEIWVCGEKQTLPESKGLSGKVGTSLLHHHNDYRIHVEGTVMNKAEVSLGNFFAAIDGALADSYIGIPQNDDSIKYWHNGDRCFDGHVGTLSLYVTKGQSVTTVENIAAYVISSETNVPPGDTLKLVFN